MSGQGKALSEALLVQLHRLLAGVGWWSGNKKAQSGLGFVPWMLAEWTGLEPATPGVTGRYSNQLNYHSVLLKTSF